MEIKQISERCLTFTFDDGITIVAIRGENHQFLCDTHLGPDSMKQVASCLKDSGDDQTLIIFNSHSDWDHIWGNCFFKNHLIIAHTSCRTRMLERGQFDLNRMKEQTRGQVTITLPNLTFSDQIWFEDEDLGFIHSPGHTTDSSLCFDRRDRVLFVGDLVEDPIPYLDDENLDRYIGTLTSLLTFPADTLISAHSGVVNRNLIEANIRYIEKVRDGEAINPEIFGEYARVHRCNINSRLMFRYEGIARTILKEKFDFASFWSLCSENEEINAAELESALLMYLTGVRVHET